MPLDEIIGEVILRPIFEIIFYSLTYWLGWLLLKLASLGNLKIASIETIGQKRKKKWFHIDWSMWTQPSKKNRILKAETACLVGTLTLAVIGYFIYLNYSHS